MRARCKPTVRLLPAVLLVCLAVLAWFAPADGASCSVSSAAAPFSAPASAGLSVGVVNVNRANLGSGVSGKTQLLTGAPLRRNLLSTSSVATITSFDVYVAAVPAAIVLQLFSNISSGGEWRLSLTRSMPVNYPLGTALGAKRVSVSWPYADGDIVALATAAGSAHAVPYDELKSDDAQAGQPSSWVAVFDGAPLSTLGDLLPNAPTSTVQRAISFAVNINQDCVSSGNLATPLCGLAPPFSSAPALGVDTAAGTSTLLVGLRVPVADYLTQVQLMVRTKQAFFVQLWTPTTSVSGLEAFVLSRSELVQPALVGSVLVPLGWPVRPGEVIGWSSGAGDVAAVEYDEEQVDTSTRVSSQVLQFDNQGADVASVQLLSLEQEPSQFQRIYRVQLFLQVSCVLRVLPTPDLRALSVASAPTLTTLFVGQPVAASSVLSVVQLYAQAIKPLSIQVFSATKRADAEALPLYKLKYSQQVTPSQLGVTTVTLQWKVDSGDVLAIASAQGDSSPVFHTLDESESAPARVLNFDEVVLSAGTALSSEAPEETFLTAGVRAYFRPLGVCTGAASLPDNAAINNCGFVRSAAGSFCAFTCASGYQLAGAIMLCSPSSQDGRLSGSQRCDPDPCRVSIGTAAGAVLGSCNATIESGTTCTLACKPGYMTTYPLGLSCTAGRISTDFKQCWLPRSCTLPTELDPGATFGNCTAGGQLAHNTFCKIALEPGSSAVNGTTILSCYDGTLSPIPRVVQTPCYLPPLPMHTRIGGCRSLMNSNDPTCHVQCEPGCIRTGDNAFKCVLGVLRGTMPKCTPAPRCALPPTTPVGALAGTCPPGGTLSPASGSCAFKLRLGYYLKAGSLTLTCTLGVLSPLPTIVPMPCTLPSPKPGGHANVGDCTFGTLATPSGTICALACDAGYETSDLPNFSCHFGAIPTKFAWPRCHLPVCQVPTVLPEGFEFGECTRGGLLRADADEFPASCTLALKAGWTTVKDASLLLSCDNTGVLSAWPSISRNVIPTIVSGPCKGPENVAFFADVGMLQHAGVPQCPPGQTMLSWDLATCLQSAQFRIGIATRVYCAENVLLDRSAGTTTVRGSCISGPILSLSGVGEVGCANEQAVVGVGFSACSSSSAALTIVCQNILPGSVRAALVNPGFTVSVARGSCAISHKPSHLADYADWLHASACPANSFNFVSVVGMSNCPLVAHDAVCVEFAPSQSGLAQLPATWYGPAVFRRSKLDLMKKPRCIVMQATRIQSVGMASAFRVWASALGPLTVQTYQQDDRMQFKVTGSFAYEVKQLGWQEIGIPLAQQWLVNPQMYVGFCYTNIPIVPGDDVEDYGDHLGFDGAFAISFSGAPVEVGENAGGGDDAGSRGMQRFYSLQLQVLPSPSLATVGFNISSHPVVDGLTNGNCLLLERPRLGVRGSVSGFRFWAMSNTGAIQLQTYRREGSSQVPRLVGSYTVPTIKKGEQNVTVPEDARWDVEPGDLLAHCYTRSSIVFRWIQNNVDEWNNEGTSRVSSNERPRIYGRYDAYASTMPHWLSFDGGIQSEYGGPVLGRVTPNFYRDPMLRVLDRDYALQIEIAPALACAPLPKRAAAGSGNVVCDSLLCELQCDDGFASSQPLQRCQPDGKWSSQGQCVAVSRPDLRESRRVGELDAYAFTLLWSPNAQTGQLPPGIVLLGWELRATLLFPIGNDVLLGALTGINSSASLSFGPAQRSYVYATDSQLAVEHASVRFEVRMKLSGGSSMWATAQLSSPCACDMYQALQLADPLQGVLIGTPLDVAASQKLDISSALLYTMTPNSLCADSYEVTVTAKDGTELGLQPSIFTVFHADSAKTCSFFTPTTKQVATVAYPMHGRELQLCVTPRPMYVCATCQSQYNDRVTDASPAPVPVCNSFTPYFSIEIAGSVKTPVTPQARIPSPVSGVRMTLTLIDDAGHTLGVSQSVETDVLGKYKLRVSSNKLARKTYVARVDAYRVTVDSATGISHEHRFELAGDSTRSYFTREMPHNEMMGEINFFDFSQVPIVGSVILSSDPNAQLYGSGALQGCGVRNITMKLYDVTDTQFTTPIASAAATGPDGQWTISASMFSTVVLVPTQDGVARVFDPPFLKVKIGQGLVHTEPIVDKTTVTLQLEIDGGNCGAHIGSVRPTIFYDSCGPSAHVLLPAFGDGAGYQYTLPAVSYTVRLYDPKNPFSGLQSVDLDGVRLPNAYLNGDVFSFVAQRTAPFTVNFATNLAPQERHFRYFAVPDFTLTTDQTCNDPKAPAGNQKYLFFQTGGPGLLNWAVSDTYGFVGQGGQKRTFVCFNVTSGLDILDGASDPEAMLLPLYQQVLGCTFGSSICTIPTVTGAKTGVTTLSYAFIAGPIQSSNFATDESGTTHTQPSYSRVVQYRPAGSVLPWKRLYIVIVGTTAIGGALSIHYPPSLPLYILRDPPGGDSFAALKPQFDLETATHLSIMRDGGTVTDISGKIGSKFSYATCTGPAAGGDSGAAVEAAVSTCSTLFGFEVSAQFGTAIEYGSTAAIEREQVQHIQVAQEVVTSTATDVIDGDGDLFLTVDGTFSLEQAQTVAVEFTVTGSGPSAVTTCSATLTPSLSWKEDEGLAYNWVSAGQIRDILQADLKLTNTLLLESHHAESLEDLIIKDTKGDDVNHFNANVKAINDWQALLDYNEQLKEEAIEWTDFWDHASVPGNSNDDKLGGVEYSQPSTDDSPFRDEGAREGAVAAFSKGMTDATINSRLSGLEASSYSDVGKAPGNHDWNPLLTNQQHTIDEAAAREISSVTFYGDSLQSPMPNVGPSSGDNPRTGMLVFHVTATSDFSSAHNVEMTGERAVGGGASLDLSLPGFISALDTMVTYTVSVKHGTEKSSRRRASNEIIISLGDADEGDQFTVKMYKDKAFGSPVYKTVAGRSRCPTEAFTVAREAPELIVGTAAFAHVNPSSSVSTMLTLLNHSPTQEDMSYSLTVNQETNTNGLRLYINGQVLSSRVEPLIFRVAAGTNVRITMQIEKGVSGYEFNDISLTLAGISNSGDQCASTNAIVSVSYDQPCSSIAFAGPLEISHSFLVNAATVEVAGAAVLQVTVRNPEVSLDKRAWKNLLDLGYLQAVDIQFRAGGASPDVVLSDADWQSISRYGEAQPNPSLVQVLQDGLSGDEPSIVNDILSVTWDVSSLADGPYQLRAVTQCKVPLGSLDTSLYTRSTPLAVGKVDVSRPELFGTPLPGLTAWLPGQEISASFTKTLACDSYFGKTRVSMWINPTLEAGPAAQGEDVAALLVCKANTVFVQMYAPLYANMVGRLLTVQLDRIYDVSGNGLKDPQVQWSFMVAPFDAKASAVRVSGLRLAGSLPTLLQVSTTSNTLATLQSDIAAEVSTLVNSFIDSTLNPTPLASQSLNGLAPGSVLVSGVATSTDGESTVLSLTVQGLPEFPGDAPLPYSPSFFSHYLLRALDNSTLWSNDVATYPLLSRLLLHGGASASSITETVFPVSSGPLASAHSGSLFAHRSMRTMDAAAPSYTLHLAQVGLVATAATAVEDVRATVQLVWQVDSATPQTLRLSDLRVYFVRLPDATSDPDDILSAQRVYVAFSSEDGSASLSSNVQAARALYSLQLLQMPTLPGGQSIALSVEVAALGTAAAYTVASDLFILGPPSAPRMLEAKQTLQDELTLTYRPSLRSGVFVTNSDSDLEYVLTIAPAGSASAVTVPARFINATSMVSTLGVRTVVARLRISALASNLSLPLPTPGNELSWSCSVRAVSVQAVSVTSSLSVALIAVPPPIAFYRIIQTALNTFQLRFFQPRLTTPDLRFVLLAKVDGVEGPQWTSSAAALPVLAAASDASSGPLLSWSVQLPSRATPYSSLAFALQVEVPVGRSDVAYQNVEETAFVSAPRNVTATALSVPTYNNDTVVVHVTWASPELLQPSIGAPILHSFVLSYTLSDGSVLASAEASLGSVDATGGEPQGGVWTANVAVPFVQSPLAGRATTYAVHVRARIFVTNNVAVLYRDDGTGLITIDSSAAAGVFMLAVPTPPSNADGTPPPAPTYPVETMDSFSVSLAEYVNPYPLEGVASMGAPAPPVGVRALRVNSRQVRVTFPAVPNAVTYAVSWFNDSSSSEFVPLPLGSASVAASQQVSGIVVALLDDVLPLVAPRVDSIFKIAVSAVNEQGALSQRTINFLRIPARISADASYRVQLSHGTAFLLPQSASLSASQMVWNVSVPLTSDLTIRILPTSPAVHSVQAVFMHAQLADSSAPFPSCASDAGVAVPAADVQTLTSCSQYAVTVYPVLHAPNVLYVQLTAEDFSVHHSQLRIRVDAAQHIVDTLQAQSHVHAFQTLNVHEQQQQQQSVQELSSVDAAVVGDVLATDPYASSDGSLYDQRAQVHLSNLRTRALAANAFTAAVGSEEHAHAAFGHESIVQAQRRASKYSQADGDPVGHHAL